MASGLECDTSFPWRGATAAEERTVEVCVEALIRRLCARRMRGERGGEEGGGKSEALGGVE